MADGDTLASLGAKITDLFTKAFASSNPNASVVFLPFALSPPADLIQPKSTTDPSPVVNAARMAAFLAENFDEPYLMSADQGAAHGKDGYYGRLSQIYPLAVTLAQPTADVGSSAWKAVNAELAMAQSVLTPAGMAYAMAASPDDWILPGNAAYWSTFDSAQSQAPAASPLPSPPIGLWQFKTAQTPSAALPALDQLHVECPPQHAPDLLAAKTAPILAREALVVQAAQAPVLPAGSASIAIAAAPRPPLISASQAAAIAPVASRAMPSNATVAPLPAAETPLIRPIPIDIPPWRLHPPPPAPATPPPAPSCSLSMHFEYMSVGIGYLNAGISMWNSVFVANPDWCVPGMTKGGLLPSPAIVATNGAAPVSYGMPVALIVVRNLKVAVNWAGQDRAALDDAGGFIGPFSLAGATAGSLADGSYAYERPGAQVIALLCTRLPVLPPQDAPDVATGATPASSPPTEAASSGGSTAATPGP